MTKKDKTGITYEQLLERSLRHLNFSPNQDSKQGFKNPSKFDQIIIPGTYIQPDFVIYKDFRPYAVIYVTHWSKPRNSAFKFWRTWEEAAQQKVVLGNQLLTINCIFDSLPKNNIPCSCYISEDMGPDPARNNEVPKGFWGWYPAISWAMIESFDITLLFPLEYEPLSDSEKSIIAEHDPATTSLLSYALQGQRKIHLDAQWDKLREIKNSKWTSIQSLEDTHSRYRIGLLHIYLFYRIVERILGRLDLRELILALASLGSKTNLQKLRGTKIFSEITSEKILSVLEILSRIKVRPSKTRKYFCELRKFTNPENKSFTFEVTWNQDLAICLLNLKHHIHQAGFIDAIYKSFERFDEVVDRANEAFDDLANSENVYKKECFVREKFLEILDKPLQLKERLILYSDPSNDERQGISSHFQNWILEMVIYLAGIDIAEDIYTHITPIFEAKGHRLRPHAPYGGDTMLVRHLLQGRDICSHWSRRSRKRTLDKQGFYDLSWESVAECIAQERRSPSEIYSEVIRRYLENKIMRVIGSSANGFHVLIEFYLSDICYLQFTDDAKLFKDQLSIRVCQSWQTEFINCIWKARPLETWMSGVSHNGQWLIKFQSAQDGHESDKTKEIAGRCRALRVSWSYQEKPEDRSSWFFSQRNLPKLALILDGDWDATKKRNLYEAGWDWVGDVSQLGELRSLIQESSED